MKLHSGLAEGQVLQRIGQHGATARLEGETRATGPVYATITHAAGPVSGWKKQRVGEAARGRFTATLAGIPAGGPYRLTLTCNPARSSAHNPARNSARNATGAAAGDAAQHEAIARIRSFHVGDVWILAGQSNMEGCGRMDDGGAARPHPLIRAFSMRREWRQAADPLHLRMESPDTCHNDGARYTREQAEDARRTAQRGVGAGVFFAREMLARSGVPQGLVCTAHGGTSMEQWNPVHKKAGGASQYGSMLLSMRATGQPCAGVLWYQGESDIEAPLAAVYTDRMKKLVAATRRDLRQPDLPWIIVQLARVFGHRTGTGWNSVQEQQRLLPTKIRKLATIAAIDLALDDPIHISATAFPRLAARLARAADRLVYANRKESPPPALRSISPMKIEKSTGAGIIDVTYENVPGGLRAAGEPQGFALLDADGIPQPLLFKTTLHGNTARLHLVPDTCPGEVRLFYGPGHTPVCNLTDGRDFALPVFGPLAFAPREARLPFVTRWRKTPLVTTPAAPLAALPCPDLTAATAAAAAWPGGTTIATWGPDGFINEHAHWQGHAGHAYFAATLTLPEPMKLDVLTGYDGPFRLWLDRKPFHTALDGINPCIPDEGRKTTTLAAGPHTLTVAMDINNGAAWGFFLRFRRRDLTAAQLKSGDYARPAYDV